MQSDNKNIFHLNDYREALKSLVLQKKRLLGQRFSFQSLATACKIQKTYLSKVLNTHSAHLSADQLYLCCEYTGLSSTQTDFLLLLQELERTGLKNRAEKIKKKINLIRKESLSASTVIETKKNTNIDNLNAKPFAQEWEQYYLEPLCQIIFVGLRIQKYQIKVLHLARDLKISKKKLMDILFTLQKLGLIYEVQGKWIAHNTPLHLPETSPLIHSFRSEMRLYALSKMKELNKEEFLGFSAVFTTDEKIAHTIRLKLLELIKEAQNLTKNSKSEKIYQLNLDFLPQS